MNELQIFDNAEFGRVRTILIENEPWFVGKDIADVLGYVDINKAVAMHVDIEDKKLNDKTSLSFGQRGTALINESGMYALVLSSKLPTARKFKHWVTSEVLPVIRKTGSYSTSNELTREQRIRVMEIVAKSYKHSLPYVLKLGKPFLEDLHSDDFSVQCKSSIERFLEVNEVLGQATKDVYENYLEFCKAESIIPTNKIQLSKKVIEILNIKIIDKKVNGEKCRLFVSK